MPSYTTTTEKDLFGIGADGDGNASCSTLSRSFSLDFEGMLDAAEGALQDEVCGFFHGPGAVQENLQQMSSFQESCFSIPPYPAGSTSLTDPFNFLPGVETLRETLERADTIGSVERSSRLPDSGLHLGLPQVPINHGSQRIRSPVRRKQFRNPGSVPGEMLPTSMGSYSAPRQIWSMDQIAGTGTFDSRASFKYAPVQPILDCAAPGGQAYIPLPRQFSAEGTSCSPSSDMILSFQPRHEASESQKTEDTVLSVQDHRVVKPKRATDHAEHIIRERIRRDDMTSKFHMLESLLPPGPKRDRATIVEDSIQYVKNLHHRVKDLQQKRFEMKSTRSTSMGPRLQGLKQQQKIRPRGPRKNMATVQIDMITSETNNYGVEKKAETCIEKAEVHLSLPEEIVIEMTCRPHAHIQSRVLGALERLRMDVTQCSISRLHGRILCSVVAKPRVIFDPPITSDDVIRALQRAVVQADL